MPLDPASLIIVFADIILAIYKQCEYYDELKDAQHNSLTRFRHISKALKDDLTLYKCLFEACLHHGNGGTLSELLRTEPGRNAYCNLESALERVENIMKELDHSVTTRAARSAAPRTPFELVIAPIVLADAIETTTEFIDNTTAQFKECQDDITRAFKFFHTLYLFHDTPLPKNSPELPPNTRGYSTALDAVVSSFHRRPFGVCSTGKDAINVDLLCLLNKDQKTADKFTKLMIDMGKIWVGDQLLEEERVNILGVLQTRLMELLWSCSLEQLKGESPGLFASVESEKSELGHDVRILEASLKGAIARAKVQKFSVAFCGMVKAGKSLFLNSLMGRTILPSDGDYNCCVVCLFSTSQKPRISELPSTAWPCRLRHQKGQKLPILTFDSTPFRRGLLQLQQRKFGQKMKSYSPPLVNLFASIVNDSDSTNTTDESNDDDLGSIYHWWSDLHQNTRQNLLRFEDSEFQLPTRADGDVAVRNLLCQINDIVRLCHRSRLGFTMDNVEWPLLIVEFDSLRDRTIEGIFEFIDLPGLGEGFDDYNFEELIRRVAKDTPAIVPIINFKEIPKEDWKRLPDIISPDLGVRTDFVICTHLDQISTDNLPEQRLNVAKVFWPSSPGFTDRIIPCSSLMGLSAYTLLHRSECGMPEFANFWDPKKIEYHCAEKILGTGNTTTNFASFNIEMWKKALDQELQRSGLPKALHRLSTDMVEKAKQRVLSLEARQLWIQLHKVTNSQRRLLLNLRRTEDEFEQAELEFKFARGKFVSALKTWEGKEAKRDQQYKQKLYRGLDLLNRTCIDAVTKALQSTIAELRDPASQSILNSTALSRRVTTSGSKATEPVKSPARNIDPHSKVIIADSKAAAEDFCYDSQKKLTHSLTEIRRQFVSTIRNLADCARKERFESLTETIKSLDDALQPELQDDILIDLNATAANVQSLAFRKVRKNIRTEAIRFGPKTAFQTLEEKVARPILRLQGNEDSDEEETHKAVEELGFMLRAPIAMIATVPFVLGAGVWPFMTKSKNYHLDTEVIGKRYIEKIVDPFLRDLKSDSEKCLFETMKKSEDASREAVVDALKREDDRYAKERAEKHDRPSKEYVAQLVASHSGFVAAEGAFEQLRERLKAFIQSDVE